MWYAWTLKTQKQKYTPLESIVLADVLGQDDCKEIL